MKLYGVEIVIHIIKEMKMYKTTNNVVPKTACLVVWAAMSTFLPSVSQQL